MRDTIFALATAAGVAGVSIVRVSGPNVADVARAFSIDLPDPRQAALRSLQIEGALVDRALVLVFEAGHSFTGEPVLELHLHGSVAIQNIVLAHLSTVPGCRPAAAGEFTKRALELGQLSLTEVEGLSDLLVAETEAQHRQALRVFDGELQRKVEGWRQSCLSLMAQITVAIDFADEDVPEDVAPEVRRGLVDLAHELAREAEEGLRAGRLRDGLEVAIIGAPNVGKSTLLNYIAGREAAITSEVAGTTRDVIEVRFNLKGLPVTFLDTAGIRSSTDVVEKMGIALAMKRAEQADLRVSLGEIPEGVAWMDEDIRVWGKADLGVNVSGIAISGVSGFGVEALLSRIHGVLVERVQSSSLAVKERHRVGFREASLSLESAAASLDTDKGVEIVAENVAVAMRHLDVVIGRVGVEDVLGEIFSSFCIGK